MYGGSERRQGASWPPTCTSRQRHDYLANGMRLHLFTELGRHVWLRRALAIFAMANLCGVALESVLPDVHDGDAVAVSALAEHVSPMPGGSGAPSRDETTGHAVHVDHCAHAHVLAAVDGMQAHGSPGPSALLIPSLISLHDSVKDAPLSRPPIT